MKEIVLKPQKSISVEDVKDTDIIGVLFMNNERLILHELEGIFVGLEKSDRDIKNKMSSESKKYYIEESFLSSSAKQAFIFETYGEAWRWALGID